MHGKYDIEVNRDIIKITISGAFNDVGAKALAIELKNIVIEFDHAPFAIMANMLEFDGGTPEVFAESEEFNTWLNSKNMVAKALIFTSPALIAIEQALVRSKAKQNIQYFKTECEALQWLNDQINQSLSKLA
tara:strand:+ start:128 stop:523 length:396 start_codon:yes stop_codon:yes gene_type:complete